MQEEFDAYPKCGRVEEGFLRVRCEHCYAEKLVAFSCKKRGFCPSCGARRMAETAALLAEPPGTRMTDLSCFNACSHRADRWGRDRVVVLPRDL